MSEIPDWKGKAISLLVALAFVVLIAVLGFVIKPNSLSYPGLAAFMARGALKLGPRRV